MKYMKQEFHVFQFKNSIFFKLFVENISCVCVLNSLSGTVVRYNRSDRRIPVIPNPVRTPELKNYTYVGKGCHQGYRND